MKTRVKELYLIAELDMRCLDCIFLLSGIYVVELTLFGENWNNSIVA